MRNLRRERAQAKMSLQGEIRVAKEVPACVGRSDSKRLGRMPIERDDLLRPGVLEKQGRVVRGKA